MGTTTGNEGHRQRLRERFLKGGLEGFHDHEVLELLLCFALPRKDVKPIAKDLLFRFGSLAGVLDTPRGLLEQAEGVGEYAAVLISLVPRLLERYRQDRWKENPTLSSTPDAVAYLAARLADRREEVFWLLGLDSRNRLRVDVKIQDGTVNRTVVLPRLIVDACVKHGATAVIFGHNHPSGDPSPSSNDLALTRKLRRILADIDIVVHDHIIVAGGSYYSFAEKGRLEE